MNQREYTYGLEWELGDTDNSLPLPSGWHITSDPDVMNMNPPLACDPENKDYHFGAEFNTRACSSINEVTDLCNNLLETHPKACVNHRMIIHAHLGWPGIREDLDGLKKYLDYSVECFPWIERNLYHFDWQHPNMTPHTRRYMTFDILPMPEYKKVWCDNADTIQEFKDGFARQKNGVINHMSIRRHYINIYSCLRIGGPPSIEHRHWHPTTNVKEIQTVFKFLTYFANEALSDNPTPVEEWGPAFVPVAPEPAPYDHTLETLWIMTNFKFNKREEVKAVRNKLLTKWKNNGKYNI